MCLQYYSTSLLQLHANKICLNTSRLHVQFNKAISSKYKDTTVKNTIANIHSKIDHKYTGIELSREFKQLTWISNTKLKLADARSQQTFDRFSGRQHTELQCMRYLSRICLANHPQQASSVSALFWGLVHASLVLPPWDHRMVQPAAYGVVLEFATGFYFHIAAMLMRPMPTVNSWHSKLLHLIDLSNK